MATAHTYYLAYRDKTLGERAANDALAAKLAETWRELAGEGEVSIVDGVSVWLDEAGALQVRVIRNATAETVTDPARVEALGALLAG